MRTDDQLQPKVVATLYLLGAFIMLIVSIQNYRYGLYPLVYSASIIMTILAGIALTSRMLSKANRANQASLWSISACLLIVLCAGLDHAVEVQHWAFALGLLAFVALKHQQAMVVTSLSSLILTLSLLFQNGMVLALSFATSYALLIALASTYARLQQQRNRTLVELEIHDPMTRAYNYRYLEDTLEKETCRADRTGKALSLVSLEVDYFPQLLDLHGTGVSQDLLRQLSESLRSMIRAGDSHYFDGEHTFYLLLPCTPSEGVVVIAERIRRSIEESAWPVIDSITVSLGCTTYVPAGQEGSAQMLIHHARIALIEAQKNGHNRVCHH